MTRSALRTLSGSIFFLFLVLSFAPSRAEAQVAPAESLKVEGDILFDKGRFAEAYDAYRRAYGIRHDPALLYNQGRALEAMGDYPEALVKLENFQWQAPDPVRKKVPKLEELIADLRGRTSTLHITTNVSGARITIRGKDVGTIVRERTVRARAGEAQLRVTADGYQPWARSLELVGGRRFEIDAQLDRSAEATPITSKWWFWTAVGVVVLAGVTTTVLLATSEKDPQAGTFGPGPIHVASF